MHHFYTGEETLEFIHALNDADKKHLLLLTDFELLNQKHNGISVIEQSKTKRAILVTSHYAKPEIQHQIMSLNVKLLPKKLASDVPLIITEPTIDYSEQQLKIVDAVWLDDDPQFTSSLEKDCAVNKKKVDMYRNPKELMDTMHIYPKDTPVFLDNNFEPPFDNELGTEVARKLHDLGFTNLFLITGDRLKQSDYPYIKILVKHNVQTLVDYL